MVLALVVAANINDNVKNKEKEHYNSDCENSIGKVLLNLVSTAVACYALYLAFKCKKGFDFGEVLFACCCFYIYVPYRLAVPCK
jgi:hypothetical protein